VRRPAFNAHRLPADAAGPAALHTARRARCARCLTWSQSGDSIGATVLRGRHRVKHAIGPGFVGSTGLNTVGFFGPRPRLRDRGNGVLGHRALQGCPSGLGHDSEQTWPGPLPAAVDRAGGARWAGSGRVSGTLDASLLGTPWIRIKKSQTSYNESLRPRIGEPHHMGSMLIRTYWRARCCVSGFIKRRRRWPLAAGAKTRRRRGTPPHGSKGMSKNLRIPRRHKTFRPMPRRRRVHVRGKIGGGLARHRQASVTRRVMRVCRRSRFTVVPGKGPLGDISSERIPTRPGRQAERKRRGIPGPDVSLIGAD